MNIHPEPPEAALVVVQRMRVSGRQKADCETVMLLSISTVEFRTAARETKIKMRVLMQVLRLTHIGFVNDLGEIQTVDDEIRENLGSSSHRSERMPPRFTVNSFCLDADRMPAFCYWSDESPQ